MTAYERLGPQFAAGAIITLRGQELVSHGCGPTGLVTVANPKARTTQSIAVEKLHDELLKGRLTIRKPDDDASSSSAKFAAVITADLTALDEQSRQAAIRRLEYVRAIERGCYSSLGPVSLEPLIREVALRINDPVIPNWRSVVRWQVAFKRYQIAGLIHRRRGNTHSRLHDDVEDKIYWVISTHYKQLTCPSLSLSHLHLKGVIKRENSIRPAALQLMVPSYNAMKRRVAEFDPFELMSARKGIQFAVNYYRTRGAAPRATRPLEVVEIDHTKFDAEVVHMGILRLGKPTLTIARDQFTGAILGFYLGFEPAGYQAVMECLLCAILPKDRLTQNDQGPTRPWTMYGIPEKLLLDNGAEFTGDDLKNACYHLGTDIEYCPPKKPWFKPHVERLFGVLRQQFTNRLKGRTFTHKEEKGDYDVNEQPLIDLEDLQKVLLIWIVDFYNEAPSGFAGLPPRAAWDMALEEAPPRMDATEDEIRVWCGRCHESGLHSYGIEFRGLYYASPALSQLWRDLESTKHFVSKSTKEEQGHQALYKFDPRDISRIWVLDRKNGNYIEADAVLKDYAKGLSLHRHNINLRYAKEIAKDKVDEAALVAASERITKMINELSLSDASRLGAKLGRIMTTASDDKSDQEAVNIDGQHNPGRLTESSSEAPTEESIATSTESDDELLDLITEGWN